MKKIKFGGKELTVDTLKSTINPAVGITNRVTNGSKSLSKQFVGWECSAKIITLDFPLQHKSNNRTIDLIGSFFYSPDLQVLIHPKDETRYFMARLDGEIYYREDGNIVYCTVTLIAPLGLSMAIAPDVFSFADGENGIVTTVENGGTYKTPASYEVVFLEDTNYVAILTDSKIIQLGTVDDIDEPRKALNQTIFNDTINGSSNKNWSENVARIRHSPDTSTLTGRLAWRSDAVVANDFGSGDGWHGPSATRFIADDEVQNWRATFRVGFKKRTSKPAKEQVGLLEGNILDKDNNFIAGFNIKKPRTSDEKVEYAFYIGDSRVFLGDIPYKYREFFGNVEIKKIGNKFYFTIGGFGDNWKYNWSYSKTFTNNDVANLRPKAFSTYFSTWAWRPSMYLRMSYAKFEKIGTDSIEEVPLTFLAGDHLEVTEQLKVFLNGMPADDYLANGSDKIYYDVGTTNVVLSSDTHPTAFATINKRYL